MIFTFYAPLLLSILFGRIMNSGNVQRKVHNNLIAAKRFKVRRNFRRSFSQISRFLFLSRAISHQASATAEQRSRHRSKRQRWLWRLSLVTWFLSTSGASQESKYFFNFYLHFEEVNKYPARTENYLLSSRVEEFLQHLFVFNKIKKETKIEF